MQPTAAMGLAPRRHPLFGKLKGTFTIAPEWDITKPAMPEWADLIDEKCGREFPPRNHQSRFASCFDRLKHEVPQFKLKKNASPGVYRRVRHRAARPSNPESLFYAPVRRTRRFLRGRRVFSRVPECLHS